MRTVTVVVQVLGGIFINSAIIISCSLFLFHVTGIGKVCCHEKTVNNFHHKQGSFLTIHSRLKLFPASLLSVDIGVLWPQSWCWVGHMYSVLAFVVMVTSFLRAQAPCW